MTEIEQPPQNGIDLSTAEEDDSSKSRPADIEQDMREMERRKRVEAIMSSKLFREELERIVDAAREGGSSGVLQQLSDIVGVPLSRVGNVFKTSNCMLPINDIRGVESMGYAKGEKILRCKLAATFRLLDLYGWTQGLGAQITARLKVDQEYFLVNPFGLLYHEITASALNKVDMQGQIIEQGTTNFGVNKNHFALHSAVHAARPDIRCVIYIGCSPVVAISSLKTGLLPLTKDACVLGEITTHPYTGSLFESEERDKFVRNLGPNSKVMLLSNHGALCCGETIEEAFFSACHIVQACETQLKLLPVGLDNLVLIPEESRKIIYEQSRRPPEDLEKKFAAISTADANAVQQGQEETAPTFKMLSGAPKWRVGGAEFEALMRMLDNAGYRTGYIYRHPLIKSEPPRPKNDVELPPAVSSLGYLLEEEELFRQGIWKKGDLRKGGDRSRWLNSPNVYQKVEVLETGTPDPKKITKWVAEGSPTHSTPVRIEDPLQFVPTGTNTKEFKRLQQQIKDNRRADKISAGPQSHILEGVTWDEANRIKDATVSSAGDHVVLMGAASKGIIQRGYQHNATVYKAPYAKNPFDNVTDDELNEYKRTVERKKKSIHGEYTDTDFSESEPLSSLQTSGAQQTKQNTTTTTAAISQSEPEDISEHQVMRIETQQAPIPSQPEVVLSDATQSFLNGERAHTAINRKTYPDRDKNEEDEDIGNEEIQYLISCPKVVNAKEVSSTSCTNKTLTANFVIQDEEQVNKENIHCGHQNILQNSKLIAEMKNDLFFKRQQAKFKSNSPPSPLSPKSTELENDKIIGDNDSNISNAQIISKHHKHCIVHNNERTSNLNPNTMCTQSCLMNASSTPIIFPCVNHAFSNIIISHTADYCKPVCYEPFLELYESKNYNNNSSAVYAESTDTSILQNEYENANSKSIFCYTPAICNRIFESLQCPLDNNLILNIPFSIAAPSSSNSTRTTTPRKIQIDNQQDISYFNDEHKLSTQHGPYRTVSHFGFNSPHQEFQPEHKHIPLQYSSVNDSRKYIPIQKTVSYEEIFSSPRYVDLCENCFERVVRLKPELLQIRTHLRNLVDFQTSTTINKQSGARIINVGDSNNEHNTIEEAVYSYPITDCEYSESNSSDTTETLPPFYSHLEPLIEAEEDEEDDDSKQITLERGNLKQACNDNIEQTVSSSSSFIEKIMRMNYSEESTNANFAQTPRTVSSNFSIETPETVTAVRENNDELQFKNVENIRNIKDNLDTKNIVQLNAYAGALNTKGTEVEVHASVTEIWEFGDWQTQKLIDVEEEGIDEKNDSKVDKNKTKNYSNNCYQQERCLMTRDERIRRKLEFQELWEDHIAYFNSRDENFTSDNELTANPDTNKFKQLEQELGNDIKHIDELHYNDKRSEVLQRNEKEIFHGCSVVMKTLPESSCQSDAEQNTQTINIITQTSTENCFFHEPSTLDCTVTNITDCRINRKATECPDLFNEFVENTVDFQETPNEQVKNLITMKRKNRNIIAYFNDNDNFLIEDDQANSQELLNTETNDNSVVSKSTININIFSSNNTKKLTTTEISELSDIEVEILEKIEKNQLKLSEEIFDKIDASIRNKLTPSKIENLLKEQQRVVCPSNFNNNNFIASTPTNILNSEHVEDNLQSTNLSDIKEYPSIAPSSYNSYEKCLTVTTKSNKVDTSIRPSNYLQKNITEHLMELHSKSYLRPNKLVFSGQKPFCNKRNFILENIRNVSKPRNLKRCKRNLLKSSCKATELLPTHCSLPLIPCANSNTLDVVTDADSVYSFESSSVNGAQRFWVSLSPRQIFREKGQTGYSGKNEHDINLKTQNTSPDEPNDSLCIVNNVGIKSTDDLLHTRISTSTFVLKNEEEHSNIEHEIQGLCEQIDEIKPRLETFKDKLYDYSDNMAMCSRNVDECIEVQKDIVSRQCELREEILLNQYMEQIACQAQTFSLSETED